MELIDTGNHHIAAWRMTDTRRGSPTYGRSVIVAHNADGSEFGGNQEFTPPNRVFWIDSVCAWDFTWKATILDDGSVSLPRFSSAIIGEYEWSGQ